MVHVSISFLKVCKEKGFKVTVLLQHIGEVKKGDVDSLLSCLWLFMANLCSFISLSKPTSEIFCKAVSISIHNVGYGLGP